MRKNKTTRPIIQQVELLELINSEAHPGEKQIECRLSINGITLEGIKLTRDNNGRFFLSVPEQKRRYGKDGLEIVPFIRLSASQRSKIKRLLIKAFQEMGGDTDA